MGVVFWDVIEEHLDEAESAWERWERRLEAHDEDLDGVEARFEERLFANLDGLDAGGAEVRKRTLIPALDEAEGARRTAAAFVLAASKDDEALRAVLKKLGDEAARADVGRALGLVPGSLSTALGPALNDGSPAVRAAALDVMTFRREAVALPPARGSDPAALVAATLRAAWLSDDRGALPLVREALSSEDIGTRDAAIAAGIALGAPEAFALCRKVVGGASESTPTPALANPLSWIAMGGNARDLEGLFFALTLAPHRKAALRALAAGGHPSGAEACLPWISDRDSGPLAADAFLAITGMPVEKGMLADPDPEDDLLPSPLPRLRRDRVEAWWQANQGRFHRSKRYFQGRLASFESASLVLAHGPMRRRGPVAEELALRSRGKARVETRAFAARQREDLARLKAPATPFEHPFG